jgi:hypothetical protein
MGQEYDEKESAFSPRTIHPSIHPSILHGELVGVASLGPHEKQQCKLETTTWGLF